MSMQCLVKLALLALALSLPLLAPSARADDEPSDPRTVVLKTYDVRDLAVTNAELMGLRNSDGTPWTPRQVSLKDGVLVVGGSAADHGVLEQWLTRRRQGDGDRAADEALTRGLAWLLEQRAADLRARAEELDRQRQDYNQQLDVLRGPDSEARRKAVGELQRTVVPLQLEKQAMAAIDRLTSRAAALERQRADLDVRVARIADLAGRLEADEHDKRASLDKEIDRITRTQDELEVMAESLAVRKTQLESALAEKRYDELRQHIAKLDAEAREREASRSARRPQANTSQRNPEERAGLLDEVRALRAEVREVKALVLKLLEQDAAEADARSAR